MTNNTTVDMSRPKRERTINSRHFNVMFLITALHAVTSCSCNMWFCLTEAEFSG
jgi:hypothetical protein